MRFQVSACLLLASVLAACASGAGNSLLGAQSATATGASNHLSSSGYTVTDLGTLGGASAGASSINNHNWVSGLSSLTSGSFIHAALWENGSSPIDLGTLGGPNSGVEWPVKNDHGLISGISETAAKQRLGEIWSCAEGFFPQPPSGHICLGFAWQQNKISKLPTLGGNNGFAAGANNHGEIVGWAETRKHDHTCTSPQVLQFEAVVYQPWGHDKTRELPPYHNDKDGAATEINDRGQIVGISGKCDQAEGRFTAHHAVLWEHGHVVNLGTLGGIAWNTPMAINERGDIVGFSDLSGDESGNPNFHAFLWTRQHGMQDLGTLPGDAFSQALGINDAGVIVGVSYGVSFSTSRAFIWQNGTMTDLNSLLPPSSQSFLLFANDINDQGVIAGGACILVSGACGSQAPAFMATPMQSAQPLQMRFASALAPPTLPERLQAMIHARALAL
jgi:probable HAF family extracellular repeat protein